MATVELIQDDKAIGKVREVFEDIKATKEIDFVPNFWRGLASSPILLEQVWDEVKAVMGDGALDRMTKEMLAYAVSATNSCDY